MAHVRYASRPQVDRPVLVCAFKGWNDAGEAASLAATYLIEQWGAERFAEMDPEDFFDFQVNRPTVRVVEGMTRELEWPRTDLHLARPGRDVVVLLGTEPNLRWRTFAGELLSVARDLGAELLVTLGAFLADVPHTLPSPVSGSASERGLLEGLGVSPTRYEGPTGIVGVLHHEARHVGLPTASLWAASPHYLPQTTNPKAALALLAKLRGLLGVGLDLDALEEAARGWERRVRETVEEDPKLSAYVQRLEEAAVLREDVGPEPSGEDLAAELERFLREQGNGER
ncbi:MAG TPA: PAC2 family protein [Actinomycetota bacterium]|nr:PAC2 family protein [Actinomycetota bacterium]